MVKYKQIRKESYREASERIARKIKKDYRVKTMHDFLSGYSDYMGVSEKEMTPRELKFREVVVKDAGLTDDYKFHKKAGGKDLDRDREKTAKTIVKTPEEYKKKGASKVDLTGFDTRRRLTIPARKKGKIVYAERTFVYIKGKQFMRFRDRSGHFVSIRG